VQQQSRRPACRTHPRRAVCSHPPHSPSPRAARKSALAWWGCNAGYDAVVMQQQGCEGEAARIAPELPLRCAVNEPRAMLEAVALSPFAAGVGIQVSTIHDIPQSPKVAHANLRFHCVLSGIGLGGFEFVTGHQPATNTTPDHSHSPPSPHPKPLPGSIPLHLQESPGSGRSRGLCVVD